MQKTTEPGLRRVIGPVSLALNAINLTIGAGIFVLPAIVAGKLGPAAFIAYLLCGLLVVLIMLCYAEVGSRITTTGGSYAYVEKAFGPLAGFLINAVFWFGFCSLADAAVINALADMLAIWFPVFSETYARVLFFALTFSLLAFINVKGVKEGSTFAATATVLKLAPLILLVVIGMFSVSSANLVVNAWPGIKDIGDASLILFFAFMGTETSLCVSGEIKDPQRNIPRGIFMGVMGVLIMYLLLQFVAQGVMGGELIRHKDAPLVALASSLTGSTGSTIILLTSVVSMFGLLSGDMLASPRLLFAAAKDKLLPGFLGMVHPRFATPYWAIIVYAACGFLFASSGGFKQLAVLASSSVLLVYLSVVLATIRLRYKNDRVQDGSFKIPGGILIPIFAVVTIGWFLSHISMDEVKAFAIFFAALTVFYFINKTVRAKRSA